MQLEPYLMFNGKREEAVEFYRKALGAEVGDVIACPPGGRETAHQIVNTGTRELKYLAVSTKLSPEIAEYPDSGKFGVLAEYAPGADGKPQGFRFIGRAELGVVTGRASSVAVSRAHVLWCGEDAAVDHADLHAKALQPWPSPRRRDGVGSHASALARPCSCSTGVSLVAFS